MGLRSVNLLRPALLGQCQGSSCCGPQRGAWAAAAQAASPPQHSRRANWGRSFPAYPWARTWRTTPKRIGSDRRFPRLSSGHAGARVAHGFAAEDGETARSASANSSPPFRRPPSPVGGHSTPGASLAQSTLLTSASRAPPPHVRMTPCCSLVLSGYVRAPVALGTRWGAWVVSVRTATSGPIENAVP
jgi:hypothetical protein